MHVYEYPDLLKPSQRVWVRHRGRTYLATAEAGQRAAANALVAVRGLGPRDEHAPLLALRWLPRHKAVADRVEILRVGRATALEYMIRCQTCVYEVLSSMASTPWIPLESVSDQHSACTRRPKTVSSGARTCYQMGNAIPRLASMQQS